MGPTKNIAVAHKKQNLVLSDFGGWAVPPPPVPLGGAPGAYPLGGAPGAYMQLLSNDSAITVDMKGL